MEHPILRLARLNYVDGSVEQAAVLRFLNGRLIEQRFESEEDCFWDQLTLAQWVRDARAWATKSIREAHRLEGGRIAHQSPSRKPAACDSFAEITAPSASVHAGRRTHEA